MTMGKTIKQIADDLKIDKQRVYRFIKKNNINEAYQENGTMYYDETAQILIKQGFTENKTHQDTHQDVHNDTINKTVIDALMKQLDVKDAQIAELQRRLAAEQQINIYQGQKLLELQTKQETVETALEPKQEEPVKKSWLQRLLGL